MQQPPCPACNGQRVIPTPSQQLYQMCPLCGGTGYWSAPGLFFSYGVDLALTANQLNVQGNILIVDRKFRWMYAVAKSTGSFTFTIADGSRPFSITYVGATNQPSTGMQNVNFWGTGQNPFPLPIPYEFPVTGNIKIVVNDTSGAPNTVNLTFHGAEIDDNAAQGAAA
jgi:hypothetical protein